MEVLESDPKAMAFAGGSSPVALVYASISKVK
jgi:hypothetical protein